MDKARKATTALRSVFSKPYESISSMVADKRSLVEVKAVYKELEQRYEVALSAWFQNPEDLPSRGCSAKRLLNSRWWEGPDWLRLSPDSWSPQVVNSNEIDISVEIQKGSSSCLYTETNTSILKINVSENYLQLNYEKNNVLTDLHPFKAEVGILRVKTKRINREDIFDFRCPILLPSKHTFTSNVGVRGLLSLIRERYWILGGSGYFFVLVPNAPNRCKRVHPMFAAALQVLHFRVFLQKTDVCVNDIINELIIIQKQQVSEHQLSDRLRKVLDDYGKYYQETENGAHGMTAKYWIIYINFFKLFQEFSRSIRTGDFDLYVSCLPQIATIMFSMNHPNYARWIVRFYNNLVNIENTHPGLKETLVQGGISIRSTEKSFSGSPIDLTLEQTINADAANKLTGSHPAKGLWGMKHTRKPVDYLVSQAKNLPPNVILQIVNFTVSETGVSFSEIVNKKTKVEPTTFSVDIISYGVQDLVYTRVFSMIVVTDDSLENGVPFECHSFVCESRDQARRITYALAAAFQDYGRKFKSENSERPIKKFAIDLRTPEEQADASDGETDA